jgi:pimeloyl-ACP methyl ester carboxylesterase
MTDQSTGLRPLILVRGFGGPDISDEQASGYQGFNDGTVYPGRRGENYIYEGFVLRAMKSSLYPYRDATNVVGYYAEEVDAPPDTQDYPADLIAGSVVLDPSVAQRVLGQDVSGTMWVYRYYDLEPRAVSRYGEGLARLIDILDRLSETRFDGVDIVAHSMGGLVVRAALKHMAEHGRDPHRLVHRIVTLGTPHRGIAFQILPRWLVEDVPGFKNASDEVAAFDPGKTEFLRVRSWFDPRRILTVVGTDYRGYGVKIASLGNRLASLFAEGTLSYNRSDGLVKQTSAQLPGAPRTFVHKCHGGRDSLVTSREAYEIAMRFFHGTHRVRLWLDEAEVLRGADLFSHSEFYVGVSIKPWRVDFELFHQSAEAENCYGPFRRTGLDDEMTPLEELLSGSLADESAAATVWAGPDRLVWEGWIDAHAKPDTDRKDMIFRLDFYVAERDSYGLGFSDNVVFRKQYYVQALPAPDGLELLIHTGEKYLGPQGESRPGQAQAAAADQNVNEVWAATRTDDGWTFETNGTGFTGTWRVAIEPDA